MAKAMTIQIRALFFSPFSQFNGGRSAQCSWGAQKPKCKILIKQLVTTKGRTIVHLNQWLLLSSGSVQSSMHCMAHFSETAHQFLIQRSRSGIDF